MLKKYTTSVVLNKNTFFDRTIFYQLKDANSAVLAREKSSSLPKLFSAELKFTIDVLNNWF